MAPSRAPGRRDGDCYSCKVWMNGLMLLFFVLGAFSSVWVFRVLEDCRFIGRKIEVRGWWEEKAQIPSSLYNLSTNQLQALALLLSSLDQGLLSECLGKSVADDQLSSSLSYALSVLQKEKNQLIGEQHLNRDNLVSQGQVPVHPDYASVQPFDLSPSHEDMLDIDLQHTSTSLNHLMPPKANDISHGGEISSTHAHKRILPVISVSILIIVIGVIVFSRGFSLGKARTSSVQQFQRQKHSQPQNSKVGVKLMKKVLFLGVSAGFLASAYIFFIMKADFIERRKETLTNMCDERARVLQDQFNVSMNHVHALAILVSTFHHGKNPSAIDQKTFEEYTASTAFERPLMSGVAYALRVLHSQREQVETQHGWKIKKMDTENHSPVQDDYFPGKLMPSPVQDEYAPVIFSQDTVAHIVSIDMMSGKEDRENILRARATGKGVLTYPFKLLKSNHLGVVLTFAVYNTVLPPNATPEQRIEATVGYLGASFDVPSLVEKLLQQLSSKQTIVVNLYDTTNASAPIKMYDPDDIGAGEMHISNVDFGDPTHKHEMHCRFTLKTPLPWLAIQTSLGIGVIVFLIGYIIYAAINTIEKVEDDYQQMRELKVRAEAADVAKSQFLATVSHEIRTPMNGVLGMLQMLMDTELDTTQQDFAMTAQSSGKALISLINEVLDLAKIESGRLELEAVPFDVRGVLDNVLSLFSDKSQAKNIELAVYVSNRVPEVLIGDPGRFRQIITNLVGNSVKFTEQGHIFVSVHLVEEVKSSCEISPQVLEDELEVFDGRYSSYKTLSGYRVADKRKSWENFSIFKTPMEASDKISLLVTVEDTGVGIPPEAQRRIFTPFMQADSSTSRTYGGTGIGLSISKSLVNLMGGEIGFVSKPGTGSAFSFTALFVEGQKKSNDVKRHKSDSSTSDFEGMRGLIADGRSIRAEIAKYHLQRLGIHVQITSTRESTLATIADALKSRTQRLDMVLVDKEAWGKGSGLPFFHPLIDTQQNGKIRSQDPPKIFLLATSLNPGEVDDLKSAGYADVMVKPLRLSMIAACLRKALGVGNKRQAKRQPVALQSLLSGKKILVVDDNAVNRRVAAGVLKKFGAMVTCVDSGKTAIQMLLPPHAFDACFMDVQMPEMDGFEATRQIRSMESKINNLIKSGETSLETYGNKAHWHVPILAMTADVIQATYEECLRCGMDDYVSKPFEEQQLYSAVAHFFESDTTEVGSE